MINAERRFEHGEKREAWLNGEPLAQIDAGSPEVLVYLHTDHLATPRSGTNAAGSTVWTWESGAFGKEAATGSATVNLRFPGQYYDSESGLHYNWNRYYNPAIGRYVSSDPIGLAGGLNTFGYAEQRPVNLVDFSGLGWLDDVKGACGGKPYGSPTEADNSNDDIIPTPSINDPQPSRPAAPPGYKVDDPQADKEHDDYKKKMDTAPPMDMDPCDQIRFKIERKNRRLGT